MDTSWNVYDYPDPPVEHTKSVNTKIYMTFNIELEVPDDWENEDIANYIKDNIDDFEWYDQEIEEIEF